MTHTAFSRIAAGLAGLAVVLGAMGAHGRVHDFIAERGTLPYWEKAVFYQLTHAIVLWALSGRAGAIAAPFWLFVAGISGFSGSLYALACAKVPWLGPVTPLGGLCLIAAWLWLVAKPPKAA